jgi:hypothetical protein
MAHPARTRALNEIRRIARSKKSNEEAGQAVRELIAALELELDISRRFQNRENERKHLEVRQRGADWPKSHPHTGHTDEG